MNEIQISNYFNKKNFLARNLMYNKYQKNHTEIIFDQFVMNITFKPYFWLGKTKVINQNIKEFFLIKKNNKQQNKLDNKQNFHYDLYVLLVNKEEIMLISSIQDFEIASEILEKLLKITQISQ